MHGEFALETFDETVPYIGFQPQRARLDEYNQFLDVVVVFV